MAAARPRRQGSNGKSRTARAGRDARLLDRWLARGRVRLKAASFAAAAAVSGTLIALLTLPILPVATYAKTSLPSAVPDTANEIGWPQFTRRPVEPLCILGDDQQRRMSRGISKQVERGEGDQKQVRRSRGRPAERSEHCLPLRTRQRVDVPLDPPRQLMQPGERELGFGLDP